MRILKCLAQEHNAMSRPGFEPGPLYPETNTLTIRLPRHQSEHNLQTNEMSDLKCNNSERVYRIEDVLNHS